MAQQREPDEKHWGDEGVTIDQIPDDEREVLLQQAGPMGEQARMAWQEHQRGQPQVDDAASIARERQRLTELGQAPPEDADALREQAPIGQEVETEATRAAEASAGPAGEGALVEGGEEKEARAEAERKASERGLEIRDYGTSGDWRVYDPKTGRQVAKSLLDEPVGASATSTS